MSKLYRPANGTDGLIFMENWCERGCLKFTSIGQYTKSCDILERSFCYDIDDPGYPSEWIYGENGKPCCTEYRNGDEADPRQRSFNGQA